MRITKLGHSCLYAETDDRAALFDPGAWATHLRVEDISRLDRIVYTHPHQDHLDIDTLRSLLEKFPDAHVIAHEEIHAQISSEGVEATFRTESQCCVRFDSPHEQVPVLNAPPIPENGYHFKGLLTHPGDSHSFTETKKVLALPFVSPWGSVTDGVKLALELKPQYILPIHDWLYTDEARDWLDGLLEKSLEGSGITLLPAEPGLTHEIPD